MVISPVKSSPVEYNGYEYDKIERTITVSDIQVQDSGVYQCAPSKTMTTKVTTGLCQFMYMVSENCDMSMPVYIYTHTHTHTHTYRQTNG